MQYIHVVSFGVKEEYYKILMKGEQKDVVFNYKDSAIFESIFKEWLPNLILFSRKITSDEYLSEDIVLTSFTKVWEGKETFQNKAQLRSYLYSTVRNTSLNYIRTEKNFSSVDDLSEDNLPLTQLAEEAFIESHVRSMLFKSLEELPDKSKEVFKLNVLEGVTLKQISEELDISENTVKTHKTRALKILREKLSSNIFSLFCAIYGANSKENK